MSGQGLSRRRRRRMYGPAYDRLQEARRRLAMWESTPRELTVEVVLPEEVDPRATPQLREALAALWRILAKGKWPDYNLLQEELNLGPEAARKLVERMKGKGGNKGERPLNLVETPSKGTTGGGVYIVPKRIFLEPSATRNSSIRRSSTDEAKDQSGSPRRAEAPPLGADCQMAEDSSAPFEKLVEDVFRRARELKSGGRGGQDDK